MARPISSSLFFSKDGNQREWAHESVGGKAVGLSKLPPNWVPPFFVIPAGGSSAVATDRQLSAAIDTILDSPQDRVIVRSSASDESLEERGRYQSHDCEASAIDVLGTVAKVRKHYADHIDEASDNELALIVQRYISPTRLGHLSNERRVSQRITSWHLEYQDSEAHSPVVSTFSTGRFKDINENDVLACDSPSLLSHRLKQVAACFDRNHRRVHIEWIWDGKRLWIVQCDDESDLKSAPPGKCWLDRARSSTVSRLELLVPLLMARTIWPKVQAVRDFHDRGFPTASIYILEDAEVLQTLAQGQLSDELTRDLNQLLSLPIIIRTDVAEGPAGSGMMLPRTDAISNIDDALLFLRANSREFINRVGKNSFCFTFHQFIAARGCAYSYASPGIGRVLIDATWGGPDSLHSYPHDSFQFDVNTKRTSKKIRCKTHFLDMSATGKWEEVKCGRPWDWKSSLSSEQISAIANIGQQMADFRGKPIEVMYFVDALDDSGDTICLPWFCTDKVATAADIGTNVRYAGRRVTVTNVDDVGALTQQWNAQLLRRPFSIRFRPQPALLRSEPLIEAVAKLSNDTDAPVELEGSILSHCYYMLQRAGVKVSSVDAFQEQIDSQRFGKLVRHKIPLRIEQHGERPRILRATRDELLRLLKAKAIEEALEFFWESEPSKIVEELADILEVVTTSAKMCGKSLEDIIECARLKYEERGGFEEGIVLLETRAVPLITRELREAGLFQDDEIFTGPRSQSKSPGYHDSRMPKSHGSSVTVSLVPPDSALGRRDVTVPIGDGSFEARIHYLDSEIRISFEQRTRRATDPRQTVFGFASETD